jgi:predicted transcriptional regulator
MKVMLSIRPEYVDKIFDGSKRFEFRKSLYRYQAIRTVVVYATRPVGMIIGEFDISEVLCDEPDALWDMTAEYSGITREFFDSYFLGRKRSYAIAVGQVRRYEKPIKPSDLIDNFTPPQSFMYVNDNLGRPIDHQFALAL